MKSFCVLNKRVFVAAFALIIASPNLLAPPIDSKNDFESISGTHTAVGGEEYGEFHIKRGNSVLYLVIMEFKTRKSIPFIFDPEHGVQFEALGSRILIPPTETGFLFQVSDGKLSVIRRIVSEGAVSAYFKEPRAHYLVEEIK